MNAPLITLLFHDLIILVIPEVADVMRGNRKKKQQFKDLNVSFTPA